MKEAWETKRETIEQSGAFAIEKLSEALSIKASSQRLPDGLSQTALDLCAEQARFVSYHLCFYLWEYMILDPRNREGFDDHCFSSWAWPKESS